MINRHQLTSPSPAISSYGSPLGQRVSYLALHSSLFGQDGALKASTLCKLVQDMITMVHTNVFDKLIWRTIGPKSFLFGTAQFSLWASGTVNYDYIVTNSINS